MADADYFLDLPSSPDPLADEVPSSVRPATRRITKSQHDLPSFSIPQSSSRGGPRAQSPRKRTFQLDVGDERTPQRIRVTVEAEESLKRGGVNRTLFPPKASSPTRSPRRRETITTTTVPLNDEAGPLDGNTSTPQKRGRPRRTSNGTPMPRGRKRAGTPIQRKSKQARQEDAQSPEAGILNEDLTIVGGEEAPKPNSRARKTPRKLSRNTPVPSSQASSKTTGRKRGRPRKVPLPEEPTVSSGTRHHATGTATPSPQASESNIENDPDRPLDTGRGEALSRHSDNDNPSPTPNPPRRSNGTAPPLYLSSPQGRTGIDRSSVSPTSSHQEMAENDDFMMSEDYQGMEPQSDLQSVEGEDGITNHGQDTIADASEFSMIAVESLPSFQASFQTSFHEDTGKLASDQHEMGEETSRIINQTLESLRQSLRMEMEGSSHAAEAQNDLKRVEDQDKDRDGMEKEVPVTTKNDDSVRGLLSSPRRMKHLPLSRQVFVGRGNVDDSFSTIPDSILHAATPRRLPTKPTASGHEHQGGQDGAYDDSFSEIPEGVLEAATPKPTRRVEMSSHGSPERSEEPHQTARPTGQRPGLGYESSRLPTPDETSSSNAGSRKAPEEDIGAGLEHQNQSDSVNRTDVPSSPPIRTRPRALDFGYSNLQHELSAVQERLSSSPKRQSSSKIAPNQLQSLEAPLPSARPSLSPIVRVGRTLQNVMSDNSSPEGREGNLGSPFRGSGSGDHPHQSLVAGSQSPSMRNRRALNHSQLSGGSSTRFDRNLRSNLDWNHGRIPPTSGEVENAATPERDVNPGTEPLRDSTQYQPSDSVTLSHAFSMPNSAKVDATNAEGEAGLAAQDDSSRRVSSRQPSFPTTTSYGLDTVRTRSTSMSEVATTDTDLHLQQDRALRDEPVQDMDEDLSDRFEEHNGDDEDDGEDFDIWDIEASRPSPTRLELARTTLEPLKSDVPSSRRSKVPSPWRRNNRRLIYKDDIASSSQIEIEESSQSEVEQYPPLRPRQRPPVSQSQQDTQRRSPDVDPMQNSPMPEDSQRLENIPSPNPSHHSFGEYAGPAESEESDDGIENEEPAVSEQPQEVLSPIPENHEEHEEHEEQELEDLDIPTVPEASADVSEYSMVAQQAKKTPKDQKKPKSGLFGGFDILSFFSSPAVLPTNKSPGSIPLEPAKKPASLQPTVQTRQPKEPPKALWSAGLFPSMPQKEARPSSGRRTDLFSPGSALRSTDTVADTYEPSTSASPSPSLAASASAAPSTPEHQTFEPIEQKRNFTPRPGQSRGSLFKSSQPTSSDSQDEVDSDLQGFSDEQESSALTESSEYERVPPREKPSQWDRNLSPTKSCFRSPLKPTTPGRIVAFSNDALSPLAEAQARIMMRNNTNAHNTVLQGPPLRPAFEDKLVPQDSTTSRANQKPHDTASTTATFALSQTTWSKQHWLRLDEMLQLRRHDPLRFQQMCAVPPRDKRRSSVLLGKEVSAQDARLVLEPWHLEIVEAFMLEVGGWDERVLAKRLFALIIGEEKRRANSL